MLIAQITDTHIKAPGQLAHGRVDTAAHLVRAVEAINTLSPAPDVILLTGDLVDSGSHEEYGQLLELLRPLRAPLFPIPGNHDDRLAFAAAFPEIAARSGGCFVQYTLEDWPVRLIGLDSLRPGSSGGELCAERLAWLEARLSEQPDRPTVIFQHHPPFISGVAHMDRLPLLGAEAEAELVQRHPNVERVLCGHLHRPTQLRWAGTIASVAPSPAYQFALDLRDDAPAAFLMEPPAYQLHLWRPDSGLISHTAYVGAFDGPHPLLPNGPATG
jgi:3',5'-cyclic AMP phosphodiesterase CpdA